MLKSARTAKLKGIINALPDGEKLELLEGASVGEPPRPESSGRRKVRFARARQNLSGHGDALIPAGQEGRPAVAFPCQAALGCSFDRELVQQVYAAIGADSRSRGLPVYPGPSVGIKRLPLCGGSSGFFSEDPLLAGELAAAAVRGVEQSGARACVTDMGSAGRLNKRYLSDAAVDARALEEIYLRPAAIAAAAGPSAIAPCEGRIRGSFCTESAGLLRDTLRGRWSFEGCTVAPAGSVSDRAAALAAGLDLEISGSEDSKKQLQEALASGEITREQLDEAAFRALELADQDLSSGAPFDYGQSHALARRAAAESAVLLKNSSGMFPIPQGEGFALIGTHALSAPMAAAGPSGSAPLTNDSAFEELRRLGARFEFAPGYTYEGDTNDLLVAEARELALRMGRAVIVAGVPDADGVDRENISLPAGVLKLIDLISSSCWQTAVVLVTGCPLELPFADRVSSILCLYYSGQCTGGAIADIITGRVNPSGRLCESWPRRLSDCPAAEGYLRNRKVSEHREGLYVGYRYYIPARVRVAFPFGHGLSYTRFTYSGLTADPCPEGGFLLRVRVQNTGSRSGAEAVQIYSMAEGSDLLQLAAFQKVHLLEGETRLLEFRLGPEAFSRFDPEKDRFRVQGGGYTLFAAGSCQDLRERVEVELPEDGEGPFPGYFPAEQAGRLSDQEFFQLLGYQPQEPSGSRATLDSTPQDLMRSTLGQNLWLEICHYLLGEQPTEQQMQQLAATVADMPLRTIADLSEGAFPRSRARMMAMIANKNVIAGAASLLFRRRKRG